MKKIFSFYTIIGIFSISLISTLLISCNDDKPKKIKIDTKKLKEPVLEINKDILKEENYLIEKYIERRQWKITTTETGLRYYIYKKTNGKRTPKVGEVSIHFEVSLLNGEKCYSTEGLSPLLFKLGNAEVVNGLEEGISLMHEGEKAILIVPAHLAFGLLGDEDKIPMRATLVYNVELIKIIK